jgi:predicted transcriptional regulator of viral defense system
MVDEISKNNQIEVADLISLREASELSGISPNHLRLLVGKGLIWGKKIDTYWVTTELAVKKYQSLGIRPGPKSKTS